MVSLAAVRTSNQTLKTAIPDVTALFVGGTAGMGQSTLRQLAIHANRPKAYIVGRSEPRAVPFLKELRSINPRGTFEFIEADVTLVKNIDKACEQIKSREKSLNLLFMTPGGISLVGRRDTEEGIDRIFALRYYSRMRFIQNLLPLLESQPEAASRVISIFGGGFELGINPSDLDLKKNYSVINGASHSITMTSLSMEHLASTHPNVSFIHAYPGIVGTSIYTNSFPAPIAAFYNYVMWPLMWPFSVDLTESGERHLYHLTSGRYPSKGAGAGTGGLPLDNVLDVAIGSTGDTGSGAYLLNWRGESKAGNKNMQQYRKEGLAEVVWKHTTDLLDEAATAVAVSR